MIRSMTGYGVAEFERDGQRLTCEIRSVNHRYCEVSLRASKVVCLFEDQIRQLIQERFSRGKFNISINWSGAGDSGEDLKLNEAVADRYVALLNQLKDRYKIDSGLDLKTLASLPDVFTWEHSAMSDEETWVMLKDIVTRASDNMNTMKAREGTALATDLLKRLDLVRAQLDYVVERAPLRPQEAKEKLQARVKSLLGDVEMDPVRIRQRGALVWRRVVAVRGQRADLLPNSRD